MTAAASSAAILEQTLEYLPVDCIQVSRTNPRRSFDAASHAELTASIKEKGVQVPLLVRPILNEFGVQTVDGVYELVCGERRFRAAQALELETVPCLVREMTDAEAREAQIVENLQRADVHPAEEAEAYAALVKQANEQGLAMETQDVARKVGKSVAYVAQRMKLLDLIPLASKLFLAQHLTLGHALLLARLTGADQVKALYWLLKSDPKHGRELPVLIDEAIQSVDGEGWRSGRRVVDATETELRRWIEGNVLLHLGRATWRLDDAALLPEAGACTACPKRSGSNAALFGDLTADEDVCLDPKCFAAKQDATVRYERDAAKQNGGELLKLTSKRGEERLPAEITARRERGGAREEDGGRETRRGQEGPRKAFGKGFREGFREEGGEEERGGVSDGIEIEQEGADAPLGFDASDRPPAGTECARCRKLYAHYCPAKGYAGEQALCLACGAGQVCEQTEARLRLERARGYDEMEVDARGLHGDCRQIAIPEADRIAAPEAAVASSAWAATVKPTLSAANLVAAGRARREVVRARRRPGKRMEADREAGRRKRMAEVMSEAKAVEVGAPPVRLSTKEAKAKAFELRGTGLSGAKIAIIVGRAQPSVAKWFRDADAEMLLPAPKTALKPAPKKTAAKKQAALARLEAALPPLPGVLEVPGGDLIAIRVPEAALDRLFALLPPAMKGAAVERLLAEMAKKGAA